MINNTWLQQLGPSQQLQFALLLSEKALRVWEHYCALQNSSFPPASNGSPAAIETDLLRKAIEAIHCYSQLHFPAANKPGIHQIYYRFVDPVVALQDGFWVCSYPVKKVFMAVYFMLKSVLEQDNSSHSESHLPTAISYALDAIEISKCCSTEELLLLVTEFKEGNPA